MPSAQPGVTDAVETFGPRRHKREASVTAALLQVTIQLALTADVLPLVCARLQDFDMQIDYDMKLDLFEEKHPKGKELEGGTQSRPRSMPTKESRVLATGSS